MSRPGMCLVLSLFALAPSSAWAQKKAPPKGPPWKTDYKSARWEALRGGKPIFLYFTKTY